MSTSANMKTFEVTVTGGPFATLRIDLPSLEAQVIVRCPRDSGDFSHSSDAHLSPPADGNDVVLTVRPEVGRPLRIDCSSSGKQYGNSGLDMNNDAVPSGTRVASKTIVLAGTNDNRDRSQADTSGTAGDDSDRQLVQASQDEDNIQSESAIPGLYGASSPEIIMATEPQDYEISWDSVPATQQPQLRKPVDADEDDEVIDSTDDETCNGGDLQSRHTSNVSAGKERSITGEQTSVAETPLEPCRMPPVVTDKSAGDLEETHPATTRAANQSSVCRSDMDRSLTAKHDESDSDDSFIGRPPAARRKTSIAGTKKKFVKKWAVNLSSDDDNSDGEGTEQAAPSNRPVLPDFESQFVVESTGQALTVPESVPPVVQGTAARQAETNEHSTIPETDAGETSGAISVVAKETQAAADPKSVTSQSQKDTSTTCLKTVIVSETVFSCNPSSNPAASPGSTHSRLVAPALELPEELTDEAKGSPAGSNEVMVADKDSSVVSETNELKASIPNRPGFAVDLVKEDRSTDDTGDKCLTARTSMLSVKSQESLRLLVPNDSLSRDDEVKRSEEMQDTNFTASKSALQENGSLSVDAAPEGTKATAIAQCDVERPVQGQDNSNLKLTTTGSIVSEAPQPASANASNTESTESIDLDGSASAMMERLKKLKNRKSAWEQAKEELVAEGVLVTCPEHNGFESSGNVKRDRMLAVSIWLSTNNVGVVEEYRNIIMGRHIDDKLTESPTSAISTESSARKLEGAAANDEDNGPVIKASWSRTSSPIVDTAPQGQASGHRHTPLPLTPKRLPGSVTSPFAEKQRRNGLSKAGAFEERLESVASVEQVIVEGSTQNITNADVTTVDGKSTVRHANEATSPTTVVEEVLVQNLDKPQCSESEPKIDNKISTIPQKQDSTVFVKACEDKATMKTSIDPAGHIVMHHGQYEAPSTADTLHVPETVPLNTASEGVETSAMMFTASSVEETLLCKGRSSPANGEPSGKQSKSGSICTENNESKKLLDADIEAIVSKDGDDESIKSTNRRQSYRRKQLYHSQDLDSQQKFDTISDSSQRRYKAAHAVPQEVASRTPKRILGKNRRTFSPGQTSKPLCASVQAAHGSTSAQSNGSAEDHTSPTISRKVPGKLHCHLDDLSDDDEVVTTDSVRPSPNVAQSNPRRIRRSKAVEASAVKKPPERRSTRGRSRDVAEAMESRPVVVLVAETLEDYTSTDERAKVETNEGNTALKSVATSVDNIASVEETLQPLSATEDNLRPKRAARQRSDVLLKRVVKGLTSSKQDPTLSQSDPYDRDTIDVGSISHGNNSATSQEKILRDTHTNAKKMTRRKGTSADHFYGDRERDNEVTEFSEEISPDSGKQSGDSLDKKTTEASRNQETFKEPILPTTKNITRNRRSRPQLGSLVDPCVEINTTEVTRNRTAVSLGDSSKRKYPHTELAPVPKKTSRLSVDLPADGDTSSVASVASSDSTLSVSRMAKLRVMFTGFENPPKNLLHELSVKTTEIPSQCSLVVATKFTRTVKMMYAVASGIPVVALDWVIQSHKAKKLLDVSNYVLHDAAAEAKYSFSLAATLRIAAEDKIFEGWTFFVTKSCVPNSEQLKEMVAGCHAKVVNRKPTQAAERTAIVSCKEDLPTLGKRNSVPVVSVEFVLYGILNHKIDMKKFKL